MWVIYIVMLLVQFLMFLHQDIFYKPYKLVPSVLILSLSVCLQLLSSLVKRINMFLLFTIVSFKCMGTGEIPPWQRQAYNEQHTVGWFKTGES